MGYINLFEHGPKAKVPSKIEYLIVLSSKNREEILEVMHALSK
jgi:hypothetical protein